MLGLMQNRPLLISNLVDYVATWHAETEIVSRDPHGVMHRSNYGQVVARARRVAIGSTFNDFPSRLRHGYGNATVTVRVGPVHCAKIPERVLALDLHDVDLPTRRPSN